MDLPHRKRVAITGMGFVTPIGSDPEQVWANLRDARPGIDLITRFDASEHPARIAGEVRDFDPTRFMDRKSARNHGRYVQYVLAASRLAVEHSGIDLAHVGSAGCGVVVGTAFGGLEVTEAGHGALLSGGVRKVSPFTIPMMPAVRFRAGRLRDGGGRGDAGAGGDEARSLSRSHHLGRACGLRLHL
jgi:3-oxoacyl-[acyl-carrier-protein] synthase II